MQLPCRACDKPAAPVEFNDQTTIAKCALCSSVLGIHGAIFSDGPRAAHAIPSGITVETEGQELVISRSWHSWVYVVLAVLSVFWMILALLLLGVLIVVWFTVSANNLGEVLTNGLLFALLPAVGVLVGAGLLYFTLAGVLNSTKIRVGQAEVSVLHGPLPWWGNASVTRGDVARVFTTEQVHFGRYGSKYFTYSVELALRGGERRTLVSRLSEVEQALFITQEVECSLGMRGEVRRA